jgi:hypothetical protein
VTALLASSHVSLLPASPRHDGYTTCARVAAIRLLTWTSFDYERRNLVTIGDLFSPV